MFTQTAGMYLFSIYSYSRGENWKVVKFCTAIKMGAISRRATVARLLNVSGWEARESPKTAWQRKFDLTARERTFLRAWAEPVYVSGESLVFLIADSSSICF